MSGHFFISDAHLGSRTPAAERRLADFLSSIKGRASSLYILGDLFEFWFSYKRVMPSAGLGILSQIAELRRNGTRVILFKGNHDVWLDERLKQELGFEGFYDELETEIDGKRVFLMHGDALDKEFLPRVFRSLMRSRLNARLFSLLHPDIGIGLARWIARKSREKGAKPSLVLGMQGFAKDKISQGFDFVIMGHSHIPERLEFEGGIYLNIGDWVKSFTYGLLDNGRLSLERF
ncbi:MAG: UDP-2,3-diacylglucosamine diphosphatase [candidate division WOR-3 bacterium]